MNKVASMAEAATDRSAPGTPQRRRPWPHLKGVVAIKKAVDEGVFGSTVTAFADATAYVIYASRGFRSSPSG